MLRGGKFNYDYPVVKSFPKPTITWTKSGGALSESQRISFSAVGNLYIGNVDVNDAGNYESKVENTVTGQSFNRGTISLGVNGKIQLSCVSEVNVHFTVCILMNGHSFIFMCTSQCYPLKAKQSYKSVLLFSPFVYLLLCLVGSL